MKKKLNDSPVYRQVKVGFPPDEFFKLEEIAMDKGTTKAELLRNCIGVKLKNVRKPIPKPLAVKEIIVDSNWRYEINKIGVNLNQAVEAMHTSRSAISLEALSCIIRQLDVLDSKVTDYTMGKDKEK